jgi:hypothetical protein
MNRSAKVRKEKVWELMEGEKKRDRMLQRIGMTGWVITLVALLFTAVGIGINVAWALGAYQAEQVGMSVIFREAMPLVWVVGAVSLLIAVLSTVGMFFRQRAASLEEIRLRIAAMEDMLSSPGDDDATQ